MALSKNATDASGVAHAPAYFRAVQVNIRTDQVIQITYTGWKDQPSYTAGFQPLPGLVKTYTIAGAAYAAVVAQPPSGSTLSGILESAIDAYALATTDEPGGVSYFAGATVVS